MKTIEERAQEYAHQYRRDAHDLKGERADAAFAAYCQGAEDEHKELTRWYDPKEIVPNHKWAVLVKLTPSIYDVASYSTEMERWIFVNYSLDREEILGWREIQE
jgi:hypothetical protein